MYQIDDLLYLMKRLRTPETGCPWDLKQSYKSIVPHTLEEAYEVADAIEKGDRNELKDELGDLLFQVIFYAQLGKEEDAFGFDDIVDNVVRKLLRRHPHVFPDQQLKAFFPEGTTFSEDEVKTQWEQIKAEERRLKNENAVEDEVKDGAFVPARDSLLKDIPVNLPALNRAEKLQRRAAQHGFDWPDMPPVLDKLEEEIAELKTEIAKLQEQHLRDEDVHQRLTDELGDVLFCCVNLARFLKVNPDEALRSTNRKFTERFQCIEAGLHTQGKSVDETSLEELDALWDQAKQNLKVD
ncbi:MAG: nucleoside triphosphate pyrophosphohydrolase [Oleiphilus sp.]|nr:MAG: nucleoside triphosphate pyrophosphohydrolase [Oleiphilus sp.]